MRTNLLPRLLSYLAVVVSMLSLAVHAQLVDVTQSGDPIVPTSNNSPGSSHGSVNDEDLDGQLWRFLHRVALKSSQSRFVVAEFYLRSSHAEDSGIPQAVQLLATVQALALHSQ